MYKELNDEAKKYLTKELKKKFLKKFNSKDLFKRCEKELSILYERNLLFIIEDLYKYKKENRVIKYSFGGTINNLLLLYVLDINYVNPLEYSLSYELFNDDTIEVAVTHEPPICLISYLDKQTDKYKIVHGFYVKTDIKSINDTLDNNYLLLPSGNLDSNMLLRFNDMDILETVNDYQDYIKKYMKIRIDEKNYINSKKVFTSAFERKISKILEPKTINDYIKIKSIAHGTDVWNNNQDKLVEEKKIDINNLIATHEDILEYLLDHKLEKDMALEITNFIRKSKTLRFPDKWNEYVKVMEEHDCEDIFIEIFSKISFIFGRGQAVSECLFVLDKSNYRTIDINLII